MKEANDVSKEPKSLLWAGVALISIADMPLVILVEKAGKPRNFKISTKNRKKLLTEGISCGIINKLSRSGETQKWLNKRSGEQKHLEN